MSGHTERSEVLSPIEQYESQTRSFLARMENAQGAEELRRAYENIRPISIGDENVVSALLTVLSRVCLGPLAELAQSLLAKHLEGRRVLDDIIRRLKSADDILADSLILTLGYRLDFEKAAAAVLECFQLDCKTSASCMRVLSRGLQYPHVQNGLLNIAKTSSDRDTRINAIRILEGSVENVVVQAGILVCFSDKDHSVGNAAIHAIAKAGKTDALRSLIEAELFSKNCNAKRCAALALTRWVGSSEPTRRKLYTAFRDPHPLVRAAAADSFRESLDDESIRERLKGILSGSTSKSEMARICAARALSYALNRDDVRECYASAYGESDVGSNLRANMLDFDIRSPYRSALTAELIQQFNDNRNSASIRARAARALRGELAGNIRLQNNFRSVHLAATEEVLLMEIASAFSFAGLEL